MKKEKGLWENVGDCVGVRSLLAKCSKHSLGFVVTPRELPDLLD